MSNHTHDAYYRAILTRDAKFDGKFFTGVKTTGVYCRPICPARPKRENVEFFSSALLAERAGYRPCLRCRPESAPDSPLWHGSSSVVRRAVRVLLGDENLSELNEDEFAIRFGVSARHLRRLFKHELGKTPMQIMRDNRLNLARKLIVETDLSFFDIAFSAGFDSVRRFNDAIRRRFSKTPTEMRKRKQIRSDSGVIEFSAAYRPPLDWQGCLDYYRKHQIGDLEQFNEGSYQRAFIFENETAVVTVRNNEEKNRLQIALQTTNVNAVSFVLSRVKEMFDLALDPVYVANAFDNEPRLKKLYQSHHGVRLARCWDRFELAITTILGQLISVKRATQLSRELMELYGERRAHPLTGESIPFFPSAQTLAGETLQALKVPGGKKSAIIALAQLVANGEIHFSTYQNPHEFKSKLMQIRGIGPWTAQMFLMFKLGRLDVLPSSDLGVQEGLRVLDGLEERPSPQELEERGAVWAPMRSVASWMMYRLVDAR